MQSRADHARAIMAALAPPPALAAAGAPPPRPPAVDVTALAAVVADITTVALPARLDAVTQHDGTSLTLRLRSATTPHARLRLCWHPDAGRLTLTVPPRRGGGGRDNQRAAVAANDADGGGGQRQRRRPRRGGGAAAASAPFSLAATLRAVLSPLILVGVAMPAAADRVVTLSWAPRADGSAPVAAVVVLELLGGGRSNVLLLDTTGGGGGGMAATAATAAAAAAAAAAGRAPTGGLIQAVGRSVPPRRAARALQSGGVYAPPPPPPGLPYTPGCLAPLWGGVGGGGGAASSPAADALGAMAADRLRAALTRMFAPVSPAVATAAVAAAAAVEAAAAAATSAEREGDEFGGGDAAGGDAAGGGALRPSARVRDVTPAQWRYLDDALGRWAACLVGDRPFRPTAGPPPASVLGTALLPDELVGPPPPPPPPPRTRRPRLAAYFSSARGATAVPVDVTVAANVRRPAAGGRGRVLGSVSFASSAGVRTVTGRPAAVEALAQEALARVVAEGEE
ncbi:hypothetical protein I4F81_010063 [Pyropia yezoensis]|uniref:Uncharacterized protein n=1 Tax=Pyropia yezoensis TaxID=2788 RepID=A0ACC3CBL7_PYRYE|nr:hypothetical protein I4F81_010063 [Neopyropia yezoensis]